MSAAKLPQAVENVSEVMIVDNGRVASSRSAAWVARLSIASEPWRPEVRTDKAAVQRASRG